MCVSAYLDSPDGRCVVNVWPELLHAGILNRPVHSPIARRLKVDDTSGEQSKMLRSSEEGGWGFLRGYLPAWCTLPLLVTGCPLLSCAEDFFNDRWAAAKTIGPPPSDYGCFEVWRCGSFISGKYVSFVSRWTLYVRSMSSNRTPKFKFHPTYEPAWPPTKTTTCNKHPCPPSTRLSVMHSRRRTLVHRAGAPTGHAHPWERFPRLDAQLTETRRRSISRSHKNRRRTPRLACSGPTSLSTLRPDPTEKRTLAPSARSGWPVTSSSPKKTRCCSSSPGGTKNAAANGESIGVSGFAGRPSKSYSCSGGGCQGRARHGEEEGRQKQKTRSVG